MRHADVIAKLSLAEKCALLQGATPFGTWPNARVGIPAMESLVLRARHVLSRADYDGKHLGC